MQPQHPLSRVSCALLALALPCAASAVQLGYQVELGIEHNDNVDLSENDPVDADILEPQLGFNLSQQGSTVQATANGVVQYRDYLGGEFSDEFRGQLAGHLNWTMVPQRLNLTVEDYSTVQPVNPLLPNAPNNQQQTNVFGIGPTLDFHFGPTVRGQAELRYIQSYADQTKEFNTNRASGALRAIKDLSPTSTISANVVDEHVDFTESDAGSNYSHYSAFGRYTRNWTEVDLVADLGYSWLNYSDGLVDDRTDPLGRANLSWRPSQRSTFTLDAAYQFSDSATNMMTGSDIGTTIPSVIVVGNATITSQAYLERRLGVGYGFKEDRLTFNVTPFYRKLDYANGGATLITGLNETGRGVGAGLFYLLRPLLTVGVSAAGENLRYDALAREDKTWTATATLRQQMTRNWSWHIDLTHAERNTDAPGLSSDQNIAYFGIAYTR
jgi:hypothetical protein